ncbi:MAG: SO_0444 family Cu/Zn efflux transporter, partial [Phycisphaeraceae bacterium]|nr:SO_0444 family Cu/Zn efflux transporter [Phycisphaeraceae bacterium]
VRAWLPMSLVERWLGRHRRLGPVWAALVGTPVPVCSCGVLPVAVSLRRGGAGRGSTASFLVATPENGVDSIALSWALLGPFLTVARPVAAIISAVTVGYVVMLTPETVHASDGVAKKDAADSDDSCCGGCCGEEAEEPVPVDVGCEAPSSEGGLWQRSVSGIRYAMSDLIDDIAGWLALGLVLAAVLTVVVPPGWLSSWGDGLTAKLVMLAVGFPMYICATASTPVAAAMLLAGLGPGTVLVFLLAGPATNVATLGVVRRELGTAAAVGFLISICVVTVLMGVAADALAPILFTPLTAEDDIGMVGHLVPEWVAIGSAVILLVVSVRPLRRWLGRLVTPAASHEDKTGQPDPALEGPDGT